MGFVLGDESTLETGIKGVELGFLEDWREDCYWDIVFKIFEPGEDLDFGVVINYDI